MLKLLATVTLKRSLSDVVTNFDSCVGLALLLLELFYSMMRRRESRTKSAIFVVSVEFRSIKLVLEKTMIISKNILNS